MHFQLLEYEIPLLSCSPALLLFVTLNPRLLIGRELWMLASYWLRPFSCTAGQNIANCIKGNDGVHFPSMIFLNKQKYILFLINFIFNWIKLCDKKMNMFCINVLPKQIEWMIEWIRNINWWTEGIKDNQIKLRLNTKVALDAKINCDKMHKFHRWGNVPLSEEKKIFFSSGFYLIFQKRYPKSSILNHIFFLLVLE